MLVYSSSSCLHAAIDFNKMVCYYEALLTIAEMKKASERDAKKIE